MTAQIKSETGQIKSDTARIKSETRLRASIWLGEMLNHN